MNRSFALLDYGLNNIQSVLNIFKYLDCKIDIVDSFVENKFKGLILPGVGNFGKAIENIKSKGLDDFVYKNINSGIPILGVCLGMHLFFDSSEESDSEGLKLINGSVKKIQTSKNFPIPHIGWNQIKFINENKLFDNIHDNQNFYFVHSYYVNCKEELITSKVKYGKEFASSITEKNIYGVQFHPEKSSLNGVKLYNNFINLCLKKEL
tara:strand:+ start:210 stop:833 length:624 start_codon:yes stop_codon:yes gene_type:complete